MASAFMMAAAEPPADTRWRPTESRRIRGEAPSSAWIRAAAPPSTSSMTGRSFFRWPWNFMPSLAMLPPATTATRWNTPEATRLAAITMAGTGAAQSP